MFWSLEIPFKTGFTVLYNKFYFFIEEAQVRVTEIVGIIRIHLTVSTNADKFEVISLRILYSHSNHQKL